MSPHQTQERHRAFDRLYRRHHLEVFRAALRATGDRDEAEEVTQSAFLDAYRAWMRGDLPREPRAWLFAIAENTRRRRYRLRASHPAEQLPDEIADERGAADAPSAREIHAALQELPERQRAVVVLREIGGLSYDEIAAELDLTVAAVQMLLFRARRALRSRLAPTGPIVALPGWLTGWAGWFANAPGTARVAGAAGALVIGLGVTVGDAPQAAAVAGGEPRATSVEPARTAAAGRDLAVPVRQAVTARAAHRADVSAHATARRVAPTSGRQARPSSTPAEPEPTPAPAAPVPEPAAPAPATPTARPEPEPSVPVAPPTPLPLPLPDLPVATEPLPLPALPAPQPLPAVPVPTLPLEPAPLPLQPPPAPLPELPLG